MNIYLKDTFCEEAGIRLAEAHKKMPRSGWRRMSRRKNNVRYVDKKMAVAAPAMALLLVVLA